VSMRRPALRKGKASGVKVYQNTLQIGKPSEP